MLLFAVTVLRVTREMSDWMTPAEAVAGVAEEEEPPKGGGPALKQVYPDKSAV